jgi:FAD synthase
VITVAFVARLRDEQRFSNMQELIAQIRFDIEDARQVLQKK